MSALIVLGVAVFGFRLVGALGVARFATWTSSAAHGLAVMLVVTASAHFAPAGTPHMPDHADMVSLVPPLVPFASALVYATGVLELLGAVGLVLARTRRLAGLALAAFFVLLFPANVYGALAEVPYDGGTAMSLWLRAPMQVLYIAVALWVAWAAPAVSARQPVTSGR